MKGKQTFRDRNMLHCVFVHVAANISECGLFVAFKYLVCGEQDVVSCINVPL